ncbi:MAG: AMP-binding protein, partial [Myxococcota bacterium]|nr:AMP-binding protein [Myxococcota bacterium]
MPESPAILAPERDSLSFAQLLEELESLSSTFNGFGIGRGDAVAIVMPQSVEQNFLIMGLAVCATAVPLNPAYTQVEFEDQFQSFEARGLLVEAGSSSPAVAAAQARGIPVFESTAQLDRPAGLSLVEWKTGSAPCAEARSASFDSATPQDVALIVLTSGTTARSKPVPLTQENLCASVAMTKAQYDLSPADRCVRIMPLFHVFGCIHQGFIPLLSGGSLVSLLDFAPARFADVLREFSPTWFGATPTFHRAILDELARAPLPAEAKKVRFILSGGSGGTASLAAQADEIYQAPLIEAYGLSEGAGLSTANPLGEGKQQPGSVGRGVGAEFGQEIAILGPGNKVLSPRKVGEVVIRGPNVFSGYLNMPEENAQLFAGDWMRTGDLGELDAEGFLYLDGRVKEIINRGGEKISPAGVDDALTMHSDVEAAVTFA